MEERDGVLIVEEDTDVGWPGLPAIGRRATVRSVKMRMGTIIDGVRRTSRPGQRPREHRYLFTFSHAHPDLLRCAV